MFMFRIMRRVGGCGPALRSQFRKHWPQERAVLRKYRRFFLMILVFQYFHLVAVRVASFLAIPRTPLWDAGFALLPDPSPQQLRRLGLILYAALLLVTLGFLASPLWFDYSRTQLRRRLLSSVMVLRISACLVVAQALRVVTFLSTSLPGPGFECRPDSPEYRPTAGLLQILAPPGFGPSSSQGSNSNCVSDLVFSARSMVALLCALVLAHYAWPGLPISTGDLEEQEAALRKDEQLAMEGVDQGLEVDHQLQFGDGRNDPIGNGPDAGLDSYYSRQINYIKLQNPSAAAAAASAGDSGVAASAGGGVSESGLGGGGLRERCLKRQTAEIAIYGFPVDRSPPASVCNVAARLLRYLALVASSLGRWGFLHWLVSLGWILAASVCALSVLARQHYTLDVFVAAYTTPLVWVVVAAFMADPDPSVPMASVAVSSSPRLGSTAVPAPTLNLSSSPPLTLGVVKQERSGASEHSFPAAQGSVAPQSPALGAVPAGSPVLVSSEQPAL